jgi:hypothetical protein
MDKNWEENSSFRDSARVLREIMKFNAKDPLGAIDGLEATMNVDSWKNVPPPVYHSVMEIIGRVKDVRGYVKNTQDCLSLI